MDSNGSYFSFGRIFGRITRDLGAFGEETDKTTVPTPILIQNFSTVAGVGALGKQLLFCIVVDILRKHDCAEIVYHLKRFGESIIDSGLKLKLSLGKNIWIPQRIKELDLVSLLEKDKFEAFFVDSLKVLGSHLPFVQEVLLMDSSVTIFLSKPISFSQNVETASRFTRDAVTMTPVTGSYNPDGSNRPVVSVDDYMFYIDEDEEAGDVS
ncbi:hypothetical protein Tco_0216265 [Tanacetum coccineum]